MLRAPVLSQMLQAYLVDLLYQTSQAGACNATHPLHRRAARWLLLACTRSEPEELPLTHEVLARVLGVRRASITECLHGFLHEGLIETSRGRIRIADRPRLEQVACPCYFMIRAQRERFQRRFEHTSGGADAHRSNVVGL
jgi:CRP-like cAMP-binding protein